MDAEVAAYQSLKYDQIWEAWRKELRIFLLAVYSIA